MGKSNETNILSIYVSNEDAGYIIHRCDLVPKYKKEIIHQLELLLGKVKNEN